MRKFNKFLALGLASASLLTGGLMLSGCDITEDKDKTQTEQQQDEQKVVSSISLNAETLPSYIIKGKFNRTNVKMTVTYEDNTTKVVDVTESMLDDASKEEIKHVGQYNLTINHGGKTATMFANVVDERYLLKEVVEANLDKDVTLINGTLQLQVDADNKIISITDSTDKSYACYTWLNNNITYNYESDESADANKSLASEFTSESYIYHTMEVLDILENGFDSDGDSWTIESIEKDGLNYILTATSTDGDGERCEHKYYFNEDFLWKTEMTYDQETTIYNLDYSILNLEVPTEIKALESSATVDIESRIENLKETMQTYLKSDFELIINDESYAKYDADSQVSCTTEDGKQVWMWLNGDYCYTHYNGEPQLNKHGSSAWEDRLKSYLFSEDALNESGFEYSVTITADGQYYELNVTTDEDDVVYKYTFNDEEISKIEVINNSSVNVVATYVKKSINLEVPADIKALESSATQS